MMPPLTEEQFNKARAAGFTTEQIISFEKQRLGGEQANPEPTYKPAVEHQNILGQVFNVPAAAIRSAIQGRGYTAGALRPSDVPTFQDLALQNLTPKTQSVALNFLGGLPASTIGLGADILTNPANLLALIAGKVPTGQGITLGERITATPQYEALAKLANKPIEEMIPKQNPAQLVDKAQKLTTEILQPSKTELQKSITQGKKLPAIEQATRVITKSKNYQELGENIDAVIKNSFQQRKALLEKDNFKVGKEYLEELKTLIAKTEDTGQATPAEINAMKDVLSREESFVQKNPNFNRVSAQARKEQLQDMTHKLLERRESGDIIDREPARNLALDALRQGLRRVVNANDPEITKINDTYGGLKDAKWLIAGQRALAEKAVPQSILEKVVRAFTKPQDIPGDIARSVLDKQFKLPARTAKIEKLMKRANR